ncbi:MAG: hypothetical protein GY928_24230 [Colwellia sp.]|nr:hypothetical protein [Colwellia sp.]
MVDTLIEQETENVQEVPKKKVVGRPFQKGNKFSTKEFRKEKKTEEDVSLSSYINNETEQGKLMADFYIGILKTIKNNRKGDKVTYKGIAIGAELVKTANEWLTVNWIGKPGKRAEEQERDDRPMDEKMKELEYQVGRAGYYLIRKTAVISKMKELGYECKKQGE